eukprot:XP_011531692.1 coiled-coil domain-containing protein 12 isoform X1 [Homo sapiens]
MREKTAPSHDVWGCLAWDSSGAGAVVAHARGWARQWSATRSPSDSCFPGVARDKEDGEPKTKHLREEEEEGEKHRELRLRNYVPEDEDLKKRRVPQAKPVAVEEKVKEQLEAAKPEPVIEEVVSAWTTLASSLLLCVLFLFATCSPSAPHSFSSLLYSLPTSPFALVPLLPPPLSPISLLLEPALPLVLGWPLHPDVCLLPSQDLANLAPRKPDW